MIENILRSLGGVGVYGIISILIFFTFFAGMLIWAVRLKRPYLNSMKGMPLDGEDGSSRPGDQTSTTEDRRHE